MDFKTLHGDGRHGGCHTNIHRQNQTTAVRNARNFTSGSGDSPVNVLETGIFVKTKIEI